MPGKRNFARERAAHAAQAPTKQSELYQHLTRSLPEHDRAIVGWPSLFRHFARLDVRRLNGQPLTVRIIRAWVRDHGFPLVRGNLWRRVRTPCFTTEHAVASWLLSRFDTASLFSVGYGTAFTPMGSFPRTQGARGRSAA